MISFGSKGERNHFFLLKKNSDFLLLKETCSKVFIPEKSVILTENVSVRNQHVMGDLAVWFVMKRNILFKSLVCSLLLLLPNSKYHSDISIQMIIKVMIVVEIIITHLCQCSIKNKVRKIVCVCLCLFVFLWFKIFRHF